MDLTTGGTGGILGSTDEYTCFQLQSVCNPGAKW
jgi:hypothetical protein